MKKIYIINCHPDNNSFNSSAAKLYADTAKGKGHEVKSLNVYDLEISYLQFKDGKVDASLTNELKQAQDNIFWADQIVIIYPVWGMSIPAKLKSFIERVFQENVLFEYSSTGPKGLLKNKTAVVVQSYAAPALMMKYLSGDPAYKTIKTDLGFCGIKVEKKFDFDFMDNSKKERKEGYLKALEKYAQKI